MTKRFRMVAGPNGSGKSTLTVRLIHDYSVNFYTRLNADEVFAEVRQTRDRCGCSHRYDSGHYQILGFCALTSRPKRKSFRSGFNDFF